MTKLTNGDTNFEIPDYVAGHLLWEAMREFREAYTALTQAAHAAADELDGRETPDHLAILKFAEDGKRATAKIADALARARMMSDGDVYDDLLFRSELGPKVDGHRKTTYIVNDLHQTEVTHVREENTGMNILAGLNVWDEDCTHRRQPIVAINTENLKEPYTYGDDGGMPIIDVDINDADIFDDAGQGDKIRQDAEEMKHKLRQVHHASVGKGDQGAFDVWNVVAEILGVTYEEDTPDTDEENS